MGGQRAVTQIQAAVGNERKRVICRPPCQALLSARLALYTQPERRLTQEPRSAAASSTTLKSCTNITLTRDLISEITTGYNSEHVCVQMPLNPVKSVRLRSSADQKRVEQSVTRMLLPIKPGSHCICWIINRFISHAVLEKAVNADTLLPAVRGLKLWP